MKIYVLCTMYLHISTFYRPRTRRTLSSTYVNEYLCTLSWLKKWKFCGKIRFHGANERAGFPDSRAYFNFSLKSKIDVRIWVFRFLKSKGGPFGEKNLKKKWFLCLIPQKNRLEKCRLAVKSVFKNIYIWGSYGPKSTWKMTKITKTAKNAYISVLFGP